VVLVHGGGWDRGDRRELAGLNRWLAARGVAVATFDYRLAPAHPWPAQAEDLRVVIGWLRENAAKLGIDPERLTLLGRSAGGQIAVATAYGETLPGVRAVVALYACHDMEFVWSIRSEHDALNSHKLMSQFLGGGPDDDEARARFRSASGEKLVHAGAPKTLLVHGKLDELVWCRHSERLAAELEKAGVPHVFIELPWATHAAEANLHGPAGQLITEAVLRAARGR
jgi:acetyl esterase/lipase